MTLLSDIKDIKDGRIFTYDATFKEGDAVRIVRGEFSGETGFIVKPTTGRFALVEIEGKKVSIDVTNLTKDAKSFSAEEAKEIGDKLKVDWSKIDVEQFRMGLDVEMEHQDVTGGDPETTGKIALAHLKEMSDYYTKLKKMEG